jgi:hypothetical protein
MAHRRIHSGVVLLFGSAIFALSGFASAEDHTGGAVFSKVMRAIQGKDCPLIHDEAGNAGTNPVDFKNLWVANDATNVYFLVEFAGPASANVSSPIFLNTDLDQTTGCNLGIPRFNGVEYGVFLSPTAFGGDFVGNMTTCSSGSDDFPDRGGIKTATVGHFIAVLVPISTLQILTPGVNGFSVWFNGGGAFGPAVYLFP